MERGALHEQSHNPCRSRDFSLLYPLQVYGEATPLSEAANVMEEERRYIRSLPDGSDMLVKAAELGKAATPQIKLIFDEANEMAYSTARLTGK